MTETEARTWTLRFAAPAEWLSSNKRYKRRPDAAIRAWRQAAAVYAQQAKLPKGLGRVSVYATLHFTNRLRRDAHNYVLVIKSCVDGLVDYGLIGDDDRHHLLWTAVTEGDPVDKKVGWGEIELRIVEEPS